MLVDDGLATGATMLSAARSARQAGASRVVAAAPVASWEATELIGTEVDELVIVQIPASLYAIGEWYENFAQVDDTEVRALLERGRRSRLEDPADDGLP